MRLTLIIGSLVAAGSFSCSMESTNSKAYQNEIPSGSGMVAGMDAQGFFQIMASDKVQEVLTGKVVNNGYSESSTDFVGPGATQVQVTKIDYSDDYIYTGDSYQLCQFETYEECQGEDFNVCQLTIRSQRVVGAMLAIHYTVNSVSSTCEVAEPEENPDVYITNLGFGMYYGNLKRILGDQELIENLAERELSSFSILHSRDGTEVTFDLELSLKVESDNCEYFIQAVGEYALDDDFSFTTTDWCVE